MTPGFADTIVAPATPSAPAIRAIVRVSGSHAFAFVDALATDDAAMSQATAIERALRLADGIDVPTTCYAFRGPRSSTGDDVVELHLPGSPLFVRLALARLIERGARMAEPGEFTARAFFHGKLDLARAEGVAATIAAANRRELDAARQLLAGELSRRLTPITDALAKLLALVEVGIDFADEAIDFLPDARLRDRIDGVDASIRSLIAHASRIERLSHEPRIVLTGRPNAGKSTLLNALAGHDRAVISDVAGTTRDALSARVTLRRGTITLVDTAGFEDASAHGTIERQMQEVATDELARADAVVRLIPIDESEPEVQPSSRAVDLIVRTKADRAESTGTDLVVSAHTGVGMDALRDRLDAIAFGGATGGGTLALNARHVAALVAAGASLADARRAIGSGHEFVAVGLRDALDLLGGVTGTISADDVLGRIFGSFCIGK